MVLIERFLAVLAGLLGAAGVALAAAAAHISSAPSLQSAALMALVHTPAIMAGLAALRSRLLAMRLGLLGIGGLAVGVILFSGDLTVRAFFDHSLFPMAAPSGGVILIASWIILSVAALFAPKMR